MKKNLVLSITLLLATLFLCSCGYEEKFTLNKSGTATMMLNVYTTAEEENLLLQELAKEYEYSGTFADFMQLMEFVPSGQQNLNGKSHNKYYIKDKCTKKEVSELFIVNDSKQSVYNIAVTEEAKELSDQLIAELGIPTDTQVDLSNLDRYRLSIKYPFKVYKTNGSKQSDGYTVVYDLSKLKADRIYAVSNSKTYKNKSCKIEGVQNKAYYNKNKKVSLQSDGVITEFRVNGNAQEKNSFTAKKDGKYKLTIKLASQASKKLSFTIDKTKPKTNIKNNQTYKGKVKISCSDKTSGIKKITLNGKKISNNKVVKKKGDYKLQITDKAGNKRTVNFKIK